ncbi:SGNH/GDSL hydrolase family protein [Roseomonas sp. NAR14]|uniref:SGNH/GDSL hydrolase family protein n=1 Tax=Roseomonas acroporae TaxID=2937791 RepID=A0A9X2BTW2_9PROT|nr:SGNH/GDSL hydrolase family protein [Roseomonas acroporae]MCK8785053.1 SGNH/GDSL hydrolase family protein [Roseomonas acroporae]
MRLPPRLAALLLAGAFALAAPAAAFARPVVVFGDSFAIGVASQLRAAGQPTVDLGRVAWSLFARDWTQRLDQLRHAADGAATVVLFLGTNDQWRGGGPAFRARLEQLRAAVPPGVPVLWVGQPTFCRADFAAGAAPIDAALRDAAARNGDGFVVPVGGCDQAGIRATDGIHFTPSGYRAIARQIARHA